MAVALLASVSCEKGRPVRDADPSPSCKFTFKQIASDSAAFLEWDNKDSLKWWYSPSSDSYSFCFPYSKLYGTDPTWVSLSIAPKQYITAGECNIKSQGIWTAVAPASKDTVTLEPHFALLKIVLDAADTPVDTTEVLSISVQADTVISGNAILNIPDSKYVIAPKGNSVSLVLKNPASLSNKVIVYAVVVPSAIKSLVLDIPCTKKFRVSAQIEEEISLTEGVCTEVNVHLASLLSEGKAKIDVERIDLSAEGTANCYVVSAPGFYKFTPTRGNTNTRPAGLVKVDWLWKDAADGLLDDIAMDDLGNVTFWAGSGKGNEIIAGFNAAGDIVWTWHIWLTDDPAANFSYGCSDKYKLLDRNLGATSPDVDNVASYGFYYQWGRKDPFIGSNTIGFAEATKRIENPAFGTGTASHAVNPLYSNHKFEVKANTSMPSGGEVEYTVAHPMTFVTGESWFANTDNLTANQGLWGWDGKSTYTKSSYDPCPAGWKVSSNNLFDTELKGLTYTLSGTKGLMAKSCTGVGGSLTTFPAAGFRDYSGGYVSYAGYVFQIWGSLYRQKSFQCWSLKSDGANEPALSRVAPSYGLSIRCVSEQ